MSSPIRSLAKWRPATLVVALPVWLIHGAAYAQDAATAPIATQQVVVTGSNVRRTDSETPSPVQVMTAADIKNSGYTSIGDVLHNITANNMGSLSQSAPSAFAAGGSGVALRGLTVGATLVLIDGHRMASYPMPDDGERDFVDISSIPIDAIERIEVLKDGASAVYGSDAIAGVVNVILKKSFTGLTMSAETGVSSHGDGATQHASITTGWGDLSKDGQNAYISLEGRHANAILLKNRPYLARTDWTPYGGANLTQGTNSGADSGASSGAGSGTGYLVDANGNNTYFPGCTTAQANADQCGYSNPYQTLSPSTTNLDVLGRYTKTLGDGWQANFQGSVLRSEAHQVGLFNNAAATGVGSGGNGGGLNLFHFGPGAAPTPAFPDSFPFVLTVPANYPGNTTGDTAALVYDFRDIGPLEQTTLSTSYRAVAELAGSIGEWDLNGSVGYTRVTTKASFYHYIDFPALQDALNSSSYLVDGTNSQAELDTVAPGASSTSTNDLSFLSVRGGRTLADLPGGPLGLSIGADFTHRQLKELFPPSFVNGSQAIGIYSFAEGKQTVSAAYAELVAPVTKQLELDVAGRVDHYDTTGTSATPKAGFKFTPVQEFVLRGTFSKGFRAPNPAEVGDAGSTSGFVGNLHDPVYCPNGPKTASNPNGGPIANLPDGMLDPCNIALQELQLSAPHLKPEKSTSFTLGAIFEPNKTYSATLDYYHITIRDQIISVGQLGQTGLDDAAQLGTIIYRDSSQNILYDTYPFINANTTTTSGLDLDVVGKYDLREAGHLKAEVQVSYMLQYDLTAQGVTYHLAGTHGPAFVSEDTGTPRTRGAFTLTWGKGPFEIAGTVNYISHYSVTDPSEGIPDCDTALSSVFPNGGAPSQFCHVGSFTELNVVARYNWDEHLQIHAGVTNLLNKKAPYDLQTFGAPGNGAEQGGAPYNPSYHQDGAVGPMITVGATYTF
jgi:iron complex outermembrane receptor protein